MTRWRWLVLGAAACVPQPAFNGAGGSNDGGVFDANELADGANTVMVTLAGSGLGTVTSTPAAISCPAVCTANNIGALIAMASPGSTFVGWEGCDSSNGTVCSVSAGGAHQVTATFGCNSGSASFSYTGAMVTYALPSCVRQVQVDAIGASGGDDSAAAGGLGGHVVATIAVPGATTLYIFVGGKGGPGDGPGSAVNSAFGSGGFNGGGASAFAANNVGINGAGGGGATDVRVGSADLPHRVVVAGGGGGGVLCPQGASVADSPGANAGANGANAAGNCDDNTNLPTGGTQTAGGMAGKDSTTGVCAAGSGSLGQGGATCMSPDTGGGGGGGYYGGGGGAWGGGAGGANLAPAGATINGTASAAGSGALTLHW